MEGPDNSNTAPKEVISAEEKTRLNSEIVAQGATVTNVPVTDQRSFYDLRASIYDQQNAFAERRQRQETMDDFYHQELRKILAGKNLSYLDFGCGTGTHTARFLEGLKEYASVEKSYAVDISDEMVKLAKGRLAGFTVVQGSAEKLVEIKLDLATSFFHVLCHLTEAELELFFKNVSTALNPGGVLCFDVIKRFDVGERGFTEEHERKGEKYLLYHSIKPDGSKVVGIDGQPVIGTDRMFTKEEIVDFAQRNDLEVVEIKEFFVGKKENIRDYAVILRKPEV